MNCHPVFGCRGHSHPNMNSELTNIIIKSIVLTIVEDIKTEFNDEVDVLAAKDIQLDNKIDAAVQTIDITTGSLQTQITDLVPTRDAYTIAKDSGYVGTESQWLASLKGEKGLKGDTGERGLTGPKGDDGLDGAIGKSGPKGDRGLTGPIGPKGTTGDKGTTGNVGPMGPIGETGLRGPKGDKGDTGSKGATGLTGPKGDIGPRGLPGKDGEKGPQGSTGPMGFKGDTGDSTYQIAQKQGFKGTEEEWLANILSDNEILNNLRDTINNTLSSTGFVTIDSFELGATITQRNQALRHAEDGKLYRWAGDLPKVVPVSSTPTSSGGMGDNAWLEISDTTLRQELANPDKGGEMVGFKQVGEETLVRNLADKAREWVSVKDFGAVGDGAHELDRRAFVRASENRKSYIIPNGEYASNSNDPIIIRDETTVQGQGTSTVVNSKIALMSNLGRLKNLQLQSVEQLQNTPAITTYENPASLEGNRSLCCTIEDVTIRNSAGIYNSAVETYLHNLNIFGTHELKPVPPGEDTRSAYGVHVPSNGLDTTYSHVFTKRTKVGLYSERAIIGFDGHFVGCDTALHLKGNGGNANQNAHFGLYADYPWINGIRLQKMNGASIYSPNVYMIGVHAASRGIEGNVFGMFFEEGSKNNLITGTNFNTNQVGLERTNSLIAFSSEAKNNIFVGIAGNYKLSQLNEDRFRKQTVMGGSGKWGRHNNINRKNRSRIHEITPAIPKTMVLHLDAEYPPTSEMVDNFFLFKGTWTMKEWGEGKRGAFGELYIVIQPDGDVDPFLENKITVVAGAEHLKLEILSTQLLGDTLEAEFKVTANSNVTLSVELERTVDPRGMMF